MLPIKFGLNPTYSLGGHVVWRISRWNAFSNSDSLCHSNASNQVTAQSNMAWEMSFETFHGSHLGYPNRTILAILNLCRSYASHQVAAQSDLGLGGDVVWRISRWPPWRPSWISEWNDFSNSESPCHCDSSHQVSAQSELRFGRRCRLVNLKMATMAAILDIVTEQF